MKPRLLLAASTALVLVAAACGGAGPSPSASSGNKPTVVIQSPANGAVVAVGQNATVMGAASDAVGVDHVALFADGVSFASTPSGQPAALVPFSLSWLATPAGPHVLQVIAYRADGTASDPAVVNVVVGAAGSGLFGSSASLPAFSFPVASQPAVVPTKKPKPSKTPPPATTQPTTPPSMTPTASPSPTPTPTPTPTPKPSPAADGTAPDDTSSEPYMIVLDPANLVGCPAELSGIPTSAIGCIWEQISAPAGDTTDQLAFAENASTSYIARLTSCTDVSGYTSWLPTGGDSSIKSGCEGGFRVWQGGGSPVTATLAVTLAPPQGQFYNQYQFTVYQCQFANCGTQ